MASSPPPMSAGAGRSRPPRRSLPNGGKNTMNLFNKQIYLFSYDICMSRCSASSIFLSKSELNKEIYEFMAVRPAGLTKNCSPCVCRGGSAVGDLVSGESARAPSRARAAISQANFFSSPPERWMRRLSETSELSGKFSGILPSPIRFSGVQSDAWLITC